MTVQDTRVPVQDTPAPAVAVRGTRSRRRIAPLGVLRRRWLGSLLLIAVLAVLIVLPGALVLLAAFTRTVPRPGDISFGLTLHNFSVLGTEEVHTALLNSVIVAVLGTCLALVIGAGLAFLSARTDIPMPKLVYMVGLMPLFLPSYVGAQAWSILAGPNAGLLNTAQHDLGLSLPINAYSVPGLVLTFAFYYAPYSFLMVHSSMSMMNPELEEAARTHGGGTLTVLRQVTLPLAIPALIGSTILTFTLIFENFPVAQVLGTPGDVNMLPTFIFRLLNMTPSHGNESAVLAVVLVAVVLVVTAVQNRLLAKRSYTTVTGKGARQKKIALGSLRYPLLLLVLLFFLSSIVLPMLALVVTAGQVSPFLNSIGDLFEPGALDFSSFGAVLGDQGFWTLTRNSVLVALAAAAIGTVLAFLSSYGVHRTKAALRRTIEAITMIPLAVPAVVLGMGLLWTWLIMPIPLYGTFAVFVIGFVAVQAPQGFRGLSATMMQTHPDLEDSAVMLGASRSRAVGAVTVPLMKVSLVSTFLLLLMLSMRELTVPLFLYTAHTRILSIGIYDAMEKGGAMQTAAAMSVLYCALMFVLSYLPRKFAAR